MATVDQREVRIVPAPAQVVADLVVRGEDDPPRQRQAVAVDLTRSVEEDRDLLPVRLVLVDPGEPGAPVVEGVEEPVLADDPVAVAHDAGVVRGMARVEVVVLQGQRGDGAAAGHRTAEQQGQAAEGVDRAAGQPHLRQAMPRAELRTLGPEPAADPLPAGRRDGDAAEGVPGAAELEPPARQLVEVELARLRDQARLVVGGLHPQAAVAHVLLHADGQEVLALGQPHDRLEGTQQHEVLARRGVTLVGHGQEPRTSVAGVGLRLEGCDEFGGLLRSPPLGVRHRDP